MDSLLSDFWWQGVELSWNWLLVEDSLVLCRQVYRKVRKQASMQASTQVSEVTKFTDLLGSGYVMLVGNHQCNAANLNQSEPQFQLELSLAPFSISLFFIHVERC